MEKRVLLATLLSLTFLFLWQYLTYKPDQQQSIQNQTQKSFDIKTEKKDINNEKLEKDVNFEPYIFETKYLKIVFNKYGAGIREVYIKEDNAYKDFYPIIKEEKDFLSLYPEIKYELKEVKDEEKTILVFSSNEKKIKKFFKFSNKDDEEKYFVEVEFQYGNEEKINFLFNHYVHSDKFTQEPNNVHIAYLKKVLDSKNKEKEILLIEKVNKINSLIERNISWLSISGKYFIFSIFLDKKIPVYISVDRYDKLLKQVNINISKNLKNYSFKLLFAPKKVKILEKLNYKLINTIEWGAFSPLSKLFYNILVFFYKIFKNYGIAIIGLTIVLQILTFPLMYNSIKSAAKMRQLQPQIQLLQKVYKDDPKRLNMEIMNLYREKKVNPFGGCLPLFLQIPIFWALFTMLKNTYDLRGAEFILWIKDLSQPDRLVIPGTNFAFPVLVLLMGATMFLQQFVSGGFSDPQQKSFAVMMPVIFTIMFFSFPSGLVLYWLISNIFSVGIQFVVNKSLKNNR